ncbi:hypothetical protein Q9966_003048 [Columba livia]|nr:hypothetical protein Q9966_003048 [Columba livia]
MARVAETHAGRGILLRRSRAALPQQPRRAEPTPPGPSSAAGSGPAPRPGPPTATAANRAQPAPSAPPRLPAATAAAAGAQRSCPCAGHGGGQTSNPGVSSGPLTARKPLSKMCDCVRLRTGVVPEGLKQPPVVTENPFSEWASSIGLGSLQDWIRVRTGGIPADQSQPPVVAESEDCELLFPLDQLWDSLAWVDMFWLISNAEQAMWLLCMVWISSSLEKWGETPGTGEQSRSVTQEGTVWWEQGSTAALAKVACNENTNPSVGKEASAGPERSSGPSPGTRQATGLKPSGSPSTTRDLPEVAQPRAVLRGWSSSRGSQGHFSDPQAPTRFIVPLALSFPGEDTDGLIFHGDRRLEVVHLPQIQIALPAGGQSRPDDQGPEACPAPPPATDPAAARQEGGEGKGKTRRAFSVSCATAARACTGVFAKRKECVRHPRSHFQKDTSSQQTSFYTELFNKHK